MVLFISPYLDKTYSGWAKFSRKLLEYNHSNSKNIDLLTLNDEIIYPLDNIGNIYFIKLKNINNHLNRLLFVIFVSYFIFKKRKVYNYIFIPNLYYYSLFFSFISNLLNIKIIGRVCGNELFFLNKKYDFRYYLLKKINKIVVLNKNNFIKLTDLKFNNIYFIPNPVDTDFFSFSKRNKKNNILFVGEVNYRKGLHILIPAFLKLNKIFKDIKLEIIGPITDYNYYNNLFKSFNINENIIFSGYLSKHDLLKRYHENDIFVLPSIIEGMPNALLEAMSSGLIVIGNDIPGINDNIINEYNGFLSKSNQDDIEKIIFNVLTDKFDNYCIKLNTRKYIEDNRSNLISFSKYISLFNFQ
jgi:glycosyltransferase involved in cell wall biosynthesis